MNILCVNGESTSTVTNSKQMWRLAGQLTVIYLFNKYLEGHTIRVFLVRGTYYQYWLT